MADHKGEEKLKELKGEIEKEEEAVKELPSYTHVHTPLQGGCHSRYAESSTLYIGLHITIQLSLSTGERRMSACPLLELPESTSHGVVI